MIVGQIINLKRMLANNKKSRESLCGMQDRRLKLLIRYAYANISYYRRMFDDKGITPDDISGTRDLWKIPITTKKQIQCLPLKDILDKNVAVRDLIKVRTNGSTGLPLEMLYTKKDYSALNINWIRPLLVNGVKPWYKRLEITGEHNLSCEKKWYNNIGLWAIDRVSIFKDPEEWVREWFRNKPDYLYGYSGSLKLFARYIKENNIGGINPKYIFGVSDLADHSCREVIKSAFDMDLLDLYGAAEAGCVAWQCGKCEGHHINSDTVIIEVVRNGKTAEIGENGNIIITNLHSYPMPFIRYDLGDIGALSESNPFCGIGLPLMKVIEGRSDAYVVMPSGRALSTLYFDNLMKPVRGVKDWKVLQDRSGKITIFIVKENDSDAVSNIRSRFENRISENVAYDIKAVEALPKDKSGKVRAVISEMDKDRRNFS